MAKRYINAGDDEPNVVKFELPSEGEHLFQVVDVFDYTNAPGKMTLDENTLCVKLEVAIGSESGRTILNRIKLDPTDKGFFATKMFLKAIGEPYKGDIEVDEDRWIGRQVYGIVSHSDYNGKTYANLTDYDFEKCEALSGTPEKPSQPASPRDVAWED